MERKENSILTPREHQVFSLLGDPNATYTHKDIGKLLNISDRTVTKHVANVKGKLNSLSRAHAIRKLKQMGEIE